MTSEELKSTLVDLDTFNSARPQESNAAGRMERWMKSPDAGEFRREIYTGSLLKLDLEALIGELAEDCEPLIQVMVDVLKDFLLDSRLSGLQAEFASRIVTTKEMLQCLRRDLGKVKEELASHGIVGDSRDVEQRLVEAVKFLKLVEEDTKEAIKILAELEGS